MPSTPTSAVASRCDRTSTRANQRQLGNVGRTLVAPQPFKASNTVSRDPVSDQEQVIHDVSWFGQGTLDIKSQLYLTRACATTLVTFGRSNPAQLVPERERWRGNSPRPPGHVVAVVRQGPGGVR